MRSGSIEVDYLVVGAGAAGMAFTDALVAHSDATVVMADRRHSPGGHWNDAYPFVRLHQPSAFYGVPSLDLGDDRIDASGPNAGFYERATAAQICHYFQRVMDDKLVASGRVEFLPMTDVVEDGPGRAQLVSRLTGRAREVVVRRKVVDARYLESSIPATSTPGFVVDDGVRCVPVNDLVRLGDAPGGYVVMGAGKTGMDACSWLLEQGVDPGHITWIRPRDGWFLDRAAFQPREKVGSFMKAYAATVEASAAATSPADLIERLDASGSLTRLDPAIEPTMFRAAILSEAEREQLRSIDHIVRAGHVRRLQTDRIVLADAEVPATTGAVYVDCTADGLPTPPLRPMFEADRVTIQQMREGSPTFNAALIGYLCATRDDLDELNALAPPAAYPDSTTDWIRARHVGMVAQRRWDNAPDVAAWTEGCRLNISSGLLDHAAEPGVADAIGMYLTQFDPAIENLAALRVQLGDDPATFP
jgi:hypothetical protein